MNDLVPTKTAAKILGVSTRQIHALARKGDLVPYYPTGKKKGGAQHFNRRDLSAYAEARAKSWGVAEAVSAAKQAYAAVRSLEELVADLISIIGADIPRLNRGPAEVMSLHIDVEDTLMNEQFFNAEDVLRWSRVLYAIDVGYLEVVEQYTGEQEPWRKYLLLAQEIESRMPAGIEDKRLYFAYSYFGMSRRNMTNVAYLYECNHNGRAAAKKLFAEASNDINNKIISVAFPVQ